MLRVFILFLFQYGLVQAVKVIDLTYDFDNETIYWPTQDADGKYKVVSRESSGNATTKFYYEANRFCAPEHGGTHLDAPRHFVYGKLSANNIPLKQLVGKAFIVDVSVHAMNNKDLLITEDHIKAAETAQGRTVDDCIVLFYTGWSKKWPNVKEYLGTDSKNVSLLHFPGLKPDAATWLTQNRKVLSVGIDTASIDFGQSKTFDSHSILFKANIPAFENVNLKQINELKKAKNLMIYALPMKIKDGSGAPLRIVASHDDSKCNGASFTTANTFLCIFLLLQFFCS